MTPHIKVTTKTPLKKSSTKHVGVKVMSKNNCVECHATSGEANKIDEYLMFWDKNIHYPTLRNYVKKTYSSVDHVFLSAYLKSKGYTSGYVKAPNGTKLKLWNKLVK